MELNVNKDENVHRYAVRGGKDRERMREIERQRRKEKGGKVVEITVFC